MDLSQKTFGELVRMLAANVASCPQHGNVSGDYFHFGSAQRELVAAVEAEINRRIAVATAREEPVGPITPRPARDEIEGEAVAPTESEIEYCPAMWKHLASLGCTRPVHTEGDHVVGKGGKIIARWPTK